MIRRKAPQVQLGNRYLKTTDPRGAPWEVVYLWTAIDGILHARLSGGEKGSRLLTIAASVLLDPHFWLPASEPR